MRDGTKAAGAFLRSELYRDASRDVEGRPAGAARAPTPARGRRSDGAGASSQRAGSRASSPTTALALLGLLDLLAG